MSGDPPIQVTHRAICDAIRTVVTDELHGMNTGKIVKEAVAVATERINKAYAAQIKAIEEKTAEIKKWGVDRILAKMLGEKGPLSGYHTLQSAMEAVIKKELQELALQALSKLQIKVDISVNERNNDGESNSIES